MRPSDERLKASRRASNGGLAGAPFPGGGVERRLGWLFLVRAAIHRIVDEEARTGSNRYNRQLVSVGSISAWQLLNSRPPGDKVLSFIPASSIGT